MDKMASDNVDTGRIRNFRYNQTLPLVKHRSDQQRLEYMLSLQPREVGEVA
jgi:hypothetical protein